MVVKALALAPTDHSILSKLPLEQLSQWSYLPGFAAALEVFKITEFKIFRFNPGKECTGIRAEDEV